MWYTANQLHMFKTYNMWYGRPSRRRGGRDGPAAAAGPLEIDDKLRNRMRFGSFWMILFAPRLVADDSDGVAVRPAAPGVEAVAHIPPQEAVGPEDRAEERRRSGRRRHFSSFKASVKHVLSLF